VKTAGITEKRQSDFDSFFLVVIYNHPVETILIKFTKIIIMANLDANSQMSIINLQKGFLNWSKLAKYFWIKKIFEICKLAKISYALVKTVEISDIFNSEEAV
jgi:hypothetical protein